MNLIVIDNFDSFIYNFVDSIQKLGHQVTVVRNAIDIEQFEKTVQTTQAQGIVISPGPGQPEQAGICMEVIQRYAGVLPIFGICLGHQAIGAAFGSKVIRAKQAVHGKRSTLFITNHNVFDGFDNGLHVGRYHSLIVDKLPNGFQLLASYQDEIQGMVQQELGVIGFQFHPESILTIDGERLIKNVLDQMNQIYKKLSNETQSKRAVS